MENRLLEQLYRKYYREILMYISSLVRDKQAAEDLTQDTFVKALMSLPDSHENVRAWLYKVAKNLTLNYLKKEGRTVAVEDVAIAEVAALRDGRYCPTGVGSTGGNISAGLGGTSAGGSEPSDEIIQAERGAALEEAIEELPEKMREAIRLQYFEGLSQKEIAKKLGMTHENVRILIHRGKRILRKILEENGYDIS